MMLLRSVMGAVASTRRQYWTANESVLHGYANSLSAYWDFEEVTGNRLDKRYGYIAQDIGGNGRVAGQYGYMYSWNNDQALKVARTEVDLAAVVATEIFTLSTWFRVANDSAGRYFMSFGDQFDTGDGLYIGKDNSGYIIAGAYSAGEQQARLASFADWDDSGWHHLLLAAPGNPMDGWTDVTPTVSTSPNVQKDPASSDPCIYTSADGQGVTKVLDSALTGSLDFTIYARRPESGVGNRGLWFQMWDSSNRSNIFVGIGTPDSDAIVVAQPGPTYPVVQAFAADTWYKIRVYDINFTSKTFKISVDDEYKNTYDFYDSAVDNLKKFQIAQNNTGGNSYFKSITLKEDGGTEFEDNLGDYWRMYIDNVLAGMGGGAVGYDGSGDSFFGYDGTGGTIGTYGQGAIDEVALWPGYHADTTFRDALWNGGDGSYFLGMG